MLWTLTANALWETTWDVPAWTEGGTVRASAESVQLGGKGVNVARVFERLGGSATAIVFLGGAAGAVAEQWLSTNGRRHVALRQQAETRRGLVVRTPGRPETTFLGRDVPLDAGARREAAALIARMPEGDCLALCGSVPGFSEEAMPELAAVLRERARRSAVVVDSYGPFLRWAAGLPLELLKINRKELSDLVGREVETGALEESVVRAAAERPWIRTWCVTDGAGAVVLVDAGAVLRLAPPPAVEVSATGAGDALLAGLMHGRLERGLAWRAALPAAVTLASAKVASPLTTEFPLPDVSWK